MSLINKITDTLGLGKEEYVVQLFDSDSRRWIDEGMSDEVTDPEEYGFDDSDPDKRRKICRKGSNTKDIMWVVGGKKRKRARKTKELGDKAKSPIDAISMQASKIKSDQAKMAELRDSISDLLGDNSTVKSKEEWMYPGMFSGMNRGLGAGFMTAFENDSGELRTAALNMVGGISGIMSVIPVIAVTIAKANGVNVGMFGIDENHMFGKSGNGAKQPEPPAKQSDIIHERPYGFDVNTSGEEEDVHDPGEFETEIDSGHVEDAEYDESKYDGDELLLEGEFEEEELVNQIPLGGDDQ